MEEEVLRLKVKVKRVQEMSMTNVTSAAIKLHNSLE